MFLCNACLICKASEDTGGFFVRPTLTTKSLTKDFFTLLDNTNGSGVMTALSLILERPDDADEDVDMDAPAAILDGIPRVLETEDTLVAQQVYTVFVWRPISFYFTAELPAWCLGR